MIHIAVNVTQLVRLSACQSLSQSVCLSVCLSACLSLSLSVCLCQMMQRWAEHFETVLNQTSNFDDTVLEELSLWP